jgi:hypothetical protein
MASADTANTVEMVLFRLASGEGDCWLATAAIFHQPSTVRDVIYRSPRQQGTSVVVPPTERAPNAPRYTGCRQ